MTRTITRIIRDPLWQFIGVIIALVALVIAILPLIGEKKAVQIVILSNSSLVKIDQSVASEISAVFQDKPVESLDLITIKLENIGKQSVRPEDYDSAIKLTFPQPSIVIGAEVIETFPPNLQFDLTINENEVIFPKSLINSGDTIIIEFKVINIPSQSRGAIPFSVSERIFEVSDIPVINVIDDQSKIEPFWQIGGVILSILAVSVSLVLFIRNLRAVALRIKVVQNTQISQLRDHELDGLNLTYKGKEVENLSLIIVEIQNTGNIPIQEDDYLQPIEFRFPTGSRVLDARVTKQNPPGINSRLLVEADRSVAFFADLLNPKDSVVLNLIVSNAYKGKNDVPFFVSTRIIGLRDVTVQ